MARRVLVTGFEPFGDHATNPSASIAGRLDGRTIAGREILGRVLPVDAALVSAALRAALDEAGDVELIVATGLAARRDRIALERVAVNRLDFDRPDNAGAVVRGRPVAENGAAELPANLPLDRILSAWLAAGIPGYISDSAGTYVCNQLFYEVLALTKGSIPAGFVHVPPSLPIEILVRAVEIAVATTLGE